MEQEERSTGMVHEKNTINMKFKKKKKMKKRKR
jgi:hypothetical protein